MSFLRKKIERWQRNNNIHFQQKNHNRLTSLNSGQRDSDLSHPENVNTNDHASILAKRFRLNWNFLFTNPALTQVPTYFG